MDKDFIIYAVVSFAMAFTGSIGISLMMIGISQMN